MNLIDQYPRLQELYSTIISDVLDDLGINNKVISASELKPLYNDVKLFGEVITALIVKYPSNKIIKKDFMEWSKVMLDFINSGGPGKVYVISTNGIKDVATWGEIMTRLALKTGAYGVITEGGIRDIPRIMSLKKRFQIYYSSATPLDAKGRIEYIAYNIEISINGVTVKPGDIVFGDSDGIVIIPREIFPKVYEMAIKKLENELAIEKGVDEGKDIRDLINRFGEF